MIKGIIHPRWRLRWLFLIHITVREFQRQVAMDSYVKTSHVSILLLWCRWSEDSGVRGSCETWDQRTSSQRHTAWALILCLWALEVCALQRKPVLEAKVGIRAKDVVLLLLFWVKLDSRVFQILGWYMATMSFHCIVTGWNSFPLWNPRTVMWFRKCHRIHSINIVVSGKSVKCLFQVNYPFKTAAQKAACNQTSSFLLSFFLVQVKI